MRLPESKAHLKKKDSADSLRPFGPTVIGTPASIPGVLLLLLMLTVLGIWLSLLVHAGGGQGAPALSNGALAPAASATSAPSTSAATSTVLPVPTAPEEHLFNIPSGDAGISVWSGTEGLYGIAAMPDGSFWVGDWSKTAATTGGRLLHYSPQGQLLIATPAPGGEQDMGGMVRDLEAYGPNLWAIVNHSLYGIGQDQKVTSINPLPDEIDAKTVVSSALEIGPNGEVLLISGADDSHPAQLLDAGGKLATFTSGADGKTNMESLPGIPAPGSTSGTPGGTHGMYTVSLGNGSGAGMGTLTIPGPGSGKQVSIREPYPITDIHILRVNKDGSVLVMAERDVGGHGSSDDALQSVLLFGSDGTLLGRAVLPIAGHYIDIVRQIAIDDSGSVYVLYKSGLREFSVDRLNFYPPIVPPPLPFLPTSTPTYTPPNPTPIPTDLQGLVRDSAAIADVDVTYSFTNGAVLRVRNWAKPFEIQMYQDSGPSVTTYASVSGDPQDMKLLVKGKRYVLFLTNPVRYGECILPPEEFNLTDGKLGVFEVVGNRISNAPVGGYVGTPISDFEASIWNMVPGSQYNGPPPPVPPDTGPGDLMALARSSDLIAEVISLYGGAGTGHYFYTYHVQEWLKKPAGFPTDDLDMSFSTSCEAIPGASLGEHLIIFLTMQQSQDAEGNMQTYYQLNGGEMGIIHTDMNGIVRWAGIGHYRGWAYSDVVRAIRADVRLSGTAIPTATPSPTPAP
jgi:hypothetical protein